MVHAPPTPPPLSTTELQDAARASGTQNPLESQSQSQSNTVPDTYQLRFPAIVEAVSRNDYLSLIQIAEEIDLTAVADRQVTRLLVIAPLVLAYLIQDQTSPARYALARLSESHAGLPLAKLLANLLNVTTNRIYPKVYATAANLVEFVSQPDFLDQDLSMVLTKLATVFMDRFRLRTFELLSRAYSSLPLALAENYLGAPSEAIIAEATKNGWTYDSASKILVPEPISKKETSRTGFSSLSTFMFIANSVGSLEA